MASEEKVSPVDVSADEKGSVSTDPRRALGNRGEEIAADFFIARGHEILARNWRCREGEIDLVVRVGDAIRIVEVKARKSLRAGLPEESITDEKLERIDDVAHRFFEERGMTDPAYHIDAVSIIFRPGAEPEVRYFPDVE